MNAYRLIFQVEPQEELNGAEFMAISRRLINEMQQLEIESAQLLYDEPPHGSKASDMAILGTMIVSVLPTVLPHLINFLIAWTQRSAGAIKIKTKKIEAEFPSGITPETLEKLLSVINGIKP